MNEYTYERTKKRINRDICAKGYGYPLLYEYRNRVDTMSPHIQTHTQTNIHSSYDCKNRDCDLHDADECSHALALTQN